jgi:predicted Zn-dependent protease
MLRLPVGLKVPFLSTHPSGQERVENLKKLIAAKQSQLKADQSGGENP